MKTYLQLIKQLQCIKTSLLLNIMKLMQVLLSLMFALSMRQVIDQSLYDVNRFKKYAILFISVVILQIIMKACIYHVEHHLELDIIKKLKTTLFEKVISNDYQTMKEYHSGELVNRFSKDINHIAMALSKQIPNFVMMIIKIIFVMIVIMMIEIKLAILLFAGGMISIFAAWIVKRHLKKIQVQLQKKEDEVDAYVQECFSSLLIIHCFHKQESMSKINQKHLEQYQKQVKHKINYINLFDTCLNIGVNLAYVLGFLFCVYGVIHNTLSIGSISAMISLIGQIQGPFVSIGLTIPQFVVFTTSLTRIEQIFEKEAYQEKRKVNYDDIEQIVFEDVSFGYNEKKVLDHYNLVIHKNEFVAFIGYSGVGKSTILKLLLNIYRIQSGRIYLKCKDCEVNIHDLEYGLFTYVPQDYVLMSGRIKEAIAFGCEEIDLAKVKYCAKLACIDEFIESLEDQYDTILKEHGQSISGGQMQRIAIARALYSDCPILLLDEATSALDPLLEKQLLQNIKTLKNKTVVIVSHRQEVMKSVDRCIIQSEVLS